MRTYLISLGMTAAGWFLAGAAAVLSLPGQDLASAAVWRAAALSGALGVVKGLAARHVGSKDSAGFR